MGAPKQKWTSEEEDALRAGVYKHGTGKWKIIQTDPEFTSILSTRSNIDLKDKWRNLSVSASGQGSRTKMNGFASSALSRSQKSNAVAIAHKIGGVSRGVGSGKNLRCGKVPSAMIMEALAAMEDPNGSEIGTICSFIEQRHRVPANFRRLLSAKLRRLSHQNKIEKVQKRYRLKEYFATRTPIPKQNDPANRTRSLQISGGGFSSSVDLEEEALRTAAYKIADAEAKAFLASEAVKEEQYMLKIVEESCSMLLLAEEIYERCARGETVMLQKWHKHG